MCAKFASMPRKACKPDAGGCEHGGHISKSAALRWCVIMRWDMIGPYRLTNAQVTFRLASLAVWLIFWRALRHPYRYVTLCCWRCTVYQKSIVFEQEAHAISSQEQFASLCAGPFPCVVSILSSQDKFIGLISQLAKLYAPAAREWKKSYNDYYRRHFIK